MIITGEKAYLKSYDPKLHNDSSMNNQVNNLIKIQNEDKKNNKVKRKESKNANNDIYKNIKNKASILTQDHREIQEKISLIQIQEQKVNDMESKLTQIERTYKQALENGKQEEIKEKIKIRVLENKVNTLDSAYKEENLYLQNNGEILSVIKDTLTKINDIKGQLAQYKAKLISLESYISRNRVQVESQKVNIERYINCEEELIINPLDFIHINQNTVNNVVISIQI